MWKSRCHVPVSVWSSSSLCTWPSSRHEPHTRTEPKERAGFCLLGHWGTINPPCQTLMSKRCGAVHLGAGVRTQWLSAEAAQLPPPKCLRGMSTGPDAAPLGRDTELDRQLVARGPWGMGQKNDKSPPIGILRAPSSSQGR